MSRSVPRLRCACIIAHRVIVLIGQHFCDIFRQFVIYVKVLLSLQVIWEPTHIFQTLQVDKNYRANLCKNNRAIHTCKREKKNAIYRDHHSGKCSFPYIRGDSKHWGYFTTWQAFFLISISSHHWSYDLKGLLIIGDVLLRELQWDRTTLSALHHNKLKIVVDPHESWLYSL